MWTLYTGYSKYVGLYLAVFTFFAVTIMPSINDYKAPFMIKMHLIIFTALCVFIGILYKCTRDLINNVLTWLIRLNIGVLFFAIDNVFIQGLLLLSTITTPYVIASDSGILLRSSFINKDLWVILTGIILFVYYNSDIDFVVNTTLFMILLAIIIPTMFHFINNKYLETRVMLLCLCIIFDIFNHNKDVLTTITDNV
jgi:hypothetical protein